MSLNCPNDITFDQAVSSKMRGTRSLELKAKRKQASYSGEHKWMSGFLRKSSLCLAYGSYIIPLRTMLSIGPNLRKHPLYIPINLS